MKRKQHSSNCYIQMTLCLVGLWAAAALAQGGAAIDGAAIPVDRRQQPQVANLVAPEFRAQHLDLPPTVAPPRMSPRQQWGPHQIGYVEQLPDGAQPAPSWQSRQDGGAALRMEFTSRDAKGLRLQLRGELNGLELRVYEPGGQAVFGPYTSFPGVWEKGETPSWWTPTIDGESIGLEFYQRKHADIQLPQLVAVSYVYEDISDDEMLDEDCLLDSTCFSAWNSEARGIGRVSFVDGGNFVCTGAMLNRSAFDFAPIFMTARHCIHNQAAANSLEIRWLYQSNICNGTVPDLSTRPRNNGALMLKLHRDSDWSLLGLFEPSNADYFLGWDSGYWNNGSAAAGIHHPSGGPKKIHFGTKSSDTTCSAAESNQQWLVVAATGAARRGASGSPAFDAAHRVRGTMSCGPGGQPEPLTCPPDEWKTYGRFDAAFPIVRWYLFDTATPAFADSSFVGDPGEDGDRERGTSENPFTTVYKASFAVPSGGDVLIRPGLYHEGGTLTISRPMTLRTTGGLVTITR
jgi:hypothetical protein